MKSDVFRLGDVWCDPTTGALTTKDGREVQLRNKSKAVLRYLPERPNRTVTKAEILNAVWSDVTVSDESLVQCIADIRRRIGPDARRIIETIPREGYQLKTSGARSSPGLLQRAPLYAAAVLAIGALVWAISDRPTGTTDSAAPLTEVTATSNPPGTASTEAYLEVLQGRLSASQFGRDESLDAERHFRKAILLDPNYARAYAELGTLLAIRFENDWNVLDEVDAAKALFYAETALDLDPDLWLAHYALGRLNSVLSNFEQAERHLLIAMSMQPENEDARAYYAVVLNLQGRPDEAMEILDSVIRSHPNPPFWYYFALRHSLYNKGRLQEAEEALTRCLEIAGTSPYCLRYLIATYGALGRIEDAETAGRAYASLGFDLAIDPMLDMVRFHDDDDKARLRSGLQLARIPE